MILFPYLQNVFNIEIISLSFRPTTGRTRRAFHGRQGFRGGVIYNIYSEHSTPLELYLFITLFSTDI